MGQDDHQSGAEGIRCEHQESSFAHPGWRVAVAAGVGVYFASLVVVAFPVLLKPLSAEFGGSRATVAGAFGCAAIAGALFATPLGFVLDRIGARRVALTCLAAFGCVFASLALLTSAPAHLYGLFALLGITGIGTSPVTYGRIVASWFSTRRGLALAVVVSGGAFGGMLHPPTAEFLTRLLGWRGACAVLGIAALLVGVSVVAGGVRERPAREVDSDGSRRAGIGFALRRRAFWLLAAGMLCGTFVQNSVLIHLHALLTDRGIGADRAAIALSVMAVAAVIGRLVTGVLVDRLPAARVGAGMLAIGACGAFLLAGAESLTAGTIAACLIAFGTGGEADVVPYLLARHFGLRGFSSLYGLAWTAGGIGAALGPFLMGRAFDTEGSYASFLGFLGWIGLAAALCMLAMPRSDPAGDDGEGAAKDPS